MSVCWSRRIALQPAAAKEAEMLAITLVVSCLSVCGFYVYVLVHLRREEKRGDAHKKRLPEHLHEMELDEAPPSNAENDPDFLGSGAARQSGSRAAVTSR